MLLPVQLLERQEVKDGSNPCLYRISQDGLPFLLPFITKQRLRISIEEMKTLLSVRAMRIPKSVPYTTFQPPKEPELSETATRTAAAGEAQENAVAGAAATEGTEAGAASAMAQRPEGGFATTAGGQAAPELERAATLEQLGSVCAGCCIVSLTCVLSTYAACSVCACWLIV